MFQTSENFDVFSQGKTRKLTKIETNVFISFISASATVGVIAGLIRLRVGGKKGSGGEFRSSS